MSKLAAKLRTQFVGLLLLFAAALMIVGGAGVWGLAQTQASANTLYSDHLQTAQITASAAQELDDAYETAQTALLVDNAPQRAQLLNSLVANEIPNVEEALRDLQRLHGQDPPSERALVQDLVDAWGKFRTLWTSDSVLSTNPDAATVDRQLREVFDQIEPITDQLQQIEQRDAQTAHQHGVDAYRSSLIVIISMTGAALLAGVLLVLIVTRRMLPRSIAPEEAQAVFVDAMQLAANEAEAQTLLTRRIEQAAPGASVAVLNHDIQSDSLYAASEPAEDSVLRRTLARATARSCVAIRTARPHRDYARDDALQLCRVCGPCPDVSMCTPLSMGGEVIGSVLVNLPRAPDADAERAVHDSIVQAAPVLANLRNLAVAKTQAATDALTGLPNKRNAADTLKRMVAQAGRSVTSLAILSIDLDHFKAINDRQGHGRGDEVLAAVGVALNSAVRAGDFPARNGGEEFLVLLPETDLGPAIACAQRIRAALYTIPVLPGESAITASIGVALLPEHAKDAASLEQAADRALYAAKRGGRNRVEVAVGTTDAPPDADPA